RFFGKSSMNIQRTRQAAMAALLGLGSTASMAQSSVELSASSFSRVGETDPRYESYNLDLSAITGTAPRTSGSGNQLAGDADAMAHRVLSGVALEKPLDLSNRRLRILAAAL